MNRPSTEEFAAAPLFRPYLEIPDEAGPDFSAERNILFGFELLRRDVGEAEVSFTLEGTPVLEAKRMRFGDLNEETRAAADLPHAMHPDLPLWIGRTPFGRDPIVWIEGADDPKAVYAAYVYDLLRERPDNFVFHMEQAGVAVGQDPFDDDEEGYDAPARIVERFGDPVRIVRKGFTCWVEGEEAAGTWGTVREGYARAGEDGNPLCPASLPLIQQLDAIESQGEKAARHRTDMKGLRVMIGAADRIADPGLRQGVHMFDLIDSEARDTVVSQTALEAHREARFNAMIVPPADADENGFAVAQIPQDPSELPAPREPERPIGEIIRETTGFPGGSFTEVRAMPTYMREQIRVVGRDLLSEHIGDMPMERVVVGRPSGSDPESYAAFMHFFAEGELVKAIEPMSHPSMPGYQTSPAEIRRRDGWDALVFSDFQGTYAYAYPSPEPTLEPEEEAPAPGM